MPPNDSFDLFLVTTQQQDHRIKLFSSPDFEKKAFLNFSANSKKAKERDILTKQKALQWLSGFQTEKAKEQDDGRQILRWKAKGLFRTKLTQVVFKQQEKGRRVTLDTIKNDVTFQKGLYDKKYESMTRDSH